MTSTPARPVAPARPEEALREVPREVLSALHRRRVAFDQGAPAIRDAAVTRPRLVAWVSTALGRAVSDRTVREAVEELRRLGHPVVSDSRVSGYWLSTDPAEIRACIERTYVGRIRHHAAAARGLQRAAQAVAALPAEQGRLIG